MGEDEPADRVWSLGGRALAANNWSNEAGWEDDDVDGGVRGDAKGAVGVVFVRLVTVSGLQRGAAAEQQDAQDAGKAPVASAEAL